MGLGKSFCYHTLLEPYKKGANRLCTTPQSPGPAHQEQACSDRSGEGPKKGKVTGPHGRQC